MKKKYIENLLNFLDQSPTAFHAAENLASMLKAGGYQELNEGSLWNLESKGKYFVLRDGALIAFQLGEKSLAEAGFKLVGAHTDSPALKVKPNPDNWNKNYFSLGVEIYGGPILNTWFDRDLSLAGRVSYLDQENNFQVELVDFKKPIAIVPNLAIHLNREVNDKNKINKQTDLPPLIFQSDKKEKVTFKELLTEELKKNNPEAAEILDYDLFFYDTQQSSLTGFNQDFISGARLDNLIHCYTGAAALLEAEQEQNLVLVCNNHEEVGSQTYSGADGAFLTSILQRICKTNENYHTALANSVLISTDNAHAIHPNYSAKHDSNHTPLLNAGPVIKTNANQRYATNAVTSGIFQAYAKLAKVPCQNFVVRTDMPCGSTIGPITSANLGVKTIDIGTPIFGMHSIRETAGVKDVIYTINLLKVFFSQTI